MQNDNLTTSENTLSLNDLSGDIDINHFINIKELIYQSFKKSKINPENKYLYYQRNENGTSILAIQVTEGDYSDLSNFMINGSTVNYYNDDIFCDVYLHADAKSSQKSLDIARLNSKDIVKFFEELEKDLLLKGLTNCSFSLRIPFQEKVHSKENTGLKKILNLIIKKSKKNLD